MARLYGVTHCSSHGSVTAGFEAALRDAGCLDGLVTLTFGPDEDVPGGATAPVGIFTGPLNRLTVMRRNAQHEERLVMVAVNSTAVPPQLIDDLHRHATGLLAPSRWNAEVLRSLTELPVMVVPHGVLPVLHACGPQPCVEAFDEGYFVVLHFSTTTGRRKGTRELAEAWCAVRHDLPVRSRLVLILDGHANLTLRDLDRPGQDVFVAPRTNLAPEAQPYLFSRAHVVAQPSRGEGFGLLPLEARACGCPVLMTACTGHHEHVGTAEDGVVVVPTGDLEAIDDGPGALAPSLRVEDVAESLLIAARDWRELKARAMARAAAFKEKWTWRNKLRELTSLLKPSSPSR